MASVSLAGVTKSYPGGVTALAGLDLRVESREFLVLLGPSGCGKSTTLRLIAGLEVLTSGEIRIDERVVTHLPPKDRDVAMVFQNYALYPHMSVYQNLAFSLELRNRGNRLASWWRGLTRRAEVRRRAVLRDGVAARVREAAQVLGLEHLLDRMPRQLSGGELQRVALGRAMVRRPTVFLLDEPLSNLDAQLRQETRRELRQLHERLGATMVYVTHDQSEAMTLGQRVAILDRGRLQQVGAPDVVYRRPGNRFVAGFVGTPPMNFVTGELAERDGQLSFVSAALELALPDRWRAAGRRHAVARRDVVLGVRPEHLRLADGRPPARAGGVPAVRAQVTAVESLGDTAFVYGQVAGETGNSKNAKREWVCKTTPDRAPRRGQCICLLVDPSEVHLFDAVTGQNLEE